jgi:hypothetical protein
MQPETRQRSLPLAGIDGVEFSSPLPSMAALEESCRHCGHVFASLIDPCCARAASGHAAALPNPAMNSRRRIRHASEPINASAYRGQGCMGTGSKQGAANKDRCNCGGEFGSDVSKTGRGAATANPPLLTRFRYSTDGLVASGLNRNVIAGLRMILIFRLLRLNSQLLDERPLWNRAINYPLLHRSSFATSRRHPSIRPC